LPPRDESVTISKTLCGPARLTPRERGLRDHSDERDRLEVGPISPRGLEPQCLELRGDVLRGDATASRGGCAAFEQIDRKRTRLRVHGGGIDRDREGRSEER